MPAPPLGTSILRVVLLILLAKLSSGVWVESSSTTGQWYAIAMSADGVTQTALWENGGLYTSSDGNCLLHACLLAAFGVRDKVTRVGLGFGLGFGLGYYNSNPNP